MPGSAARRLLSLALPLAALLLSRPSPLAAQPSPPAPPQTTRAEGAGVSVPIEVREQFLGRSGEKTVVRFLLSASRADLRKAGADRPRVFTFFVAGEAKDEKGAVADTFRVPVDVDMSDATEGQPLAISFLRALPPGRLVLNFRFEAENGRGVGLRSVTIDVPRMSSEFVATDAGLLASGFLSAPAVILEAENRPAVTAEGPLVRIVAPKREVPVGLLRVEAEVQPPVTKVEFYLDETKLVTRNRPPFTVEIDLGTVPRRQTLKALGFDRQGNFVDADAWAINEREARLAVRILELPKKAEGGVEVKVAVQSIAGGRATTVKLFADTELVKEWSAPPYQVTVPAATLARATLLRATAVDEEGKEFSDLRFTKGEGRFLSRVEVNLVELNVTVLDEAGRFARDLGKDDFEVLEDGVPQTLGSFEFAESLPLAFGLVVDGSGSMQKSMPVVKQAANEFVTRLMTEKDQGFVMEFREQPMLLAPMTKSRADLLRGISEARADGGTALYDSIVMALYQFRALAGKKALVVLTDGKDNRSASEYETLRRYVRTAGVPVYFVGLDVSFLDVGLRSRLKELAGDTGGDAFFIGSAKDLAEVYRRIETEVRAQYFTSYLTESKKAEGEFRAVEVRLKKPGLKAKTIRGYFP
ncbi:MAG: VWA domain-containing protein [Acidobacteria bacterium]|nr:MAG: VWA domain-containing protein [Acidobacteriota bacterium]MCE7959530.1 VWA domain-containing protein [Acidobacteria bacterium ACB2]